MNPTTPVQLNAAYDRDLLEDAARSYVRRYFRGRGRWLMAACVINALGFAAVISLGATFNAHTWCVAFIATIGPLYCAYLIYAFPRRYASRALRLLGPNAQISFTESVLEVTAKDPASPIPWHLIKAVWEFPAGFLLVFSQLIHAFIVIPKSGLPTEARELLDGKVGEHAGAELAGVVGRSGQR